MNKKPIISRYVAKAKNRLAAFFSKQSKAKMEGKLHSSKGEANFEKITTINVKRKKWIGKVDMYSNIPSPLRQILEQNL